MHWIQTVTYSESSRICCIFLTIKAVYGTKGDRPFSDFAGQRIEFREHRIKTTLWSLILTPGTSPLEEEEDNKVELLRGLKEYK